MREEQTRKLMEFIQVQNEWNTEIGKSLVAIDKALNMIAKELSAYRPPATR